MELAAARRGEMGDIEKPSTAAAALLDDIVPHQGSSYMSTYRMPTIAAILPEYTNAESDHIYNAFNQGSYTTLQALPEHLRCHEVRKVDVVRRWCPRECGNQGIEHRSQSRPLPPGCPKRGDTRHATRHYFRALGALGASAFGTSGVRARPKQDKFFECLQGGLETETLTEYGPPVHGVTDQSHAGASDGGGAESAAWGSGHVGLCRRHQVVPRIRLPP